MSVENAKTVMQLLAGKTLTNAQMASIGRNYLADFDPVENPYDPVDFPDEYNAWPTADELGQMFLDRMRFEARQHVKNAAREKALAAVESIATDAEDEL